MAKHRGTRNQQGRGRGRPPFDPAQRAPRGAARRQPAAAPAGNRPDPPEGTCRDGHLACLVSEDLFAGPGPGAPPSDVDPRYHLPSDLSVDAGYAADTARLVTAAAWVAATR